MPVYPFYDSETDGFAYHVIPDCHSYAESISDIISESESAASGTTIRSDDVSDYFIEHHGRQQPAGENAIRWFPTDNTKRFILRHAASKYLFGHNYVGPVGEMLRSEPGKKHHVLEIGTRDGTWIQEMATEFPHVQFRSLDLAPVMAHAPRANIVFEVYDIAGGLLLEGNTQDIVFVNMAIELVKDYRALLLEVHRVLRPGGLVYIREYLPALWDSQDDTKLARRTNPIICHVYDLTRNLIVKLGVDPDLVEKLPLWLTPDSDLWQGSNLARGFEQIHTVFKTYPVYPHEGHPCSTTLDPRLVPLLGHLTGLHARDLFGLLRDAGLSVEEANLLLDAAVEEWKDPAKCPLFKLCYIYASKNV